MIMNLGDFFHPNDETFWEKGHILVKNNNFLIFEYAVALLSAI